MSENKVVFEGPDGRLYEMPADVLASYVVPGPRVAEVRARMGKAAAAAPTSTAGKLPPGHFREPPPATAPAPIVLNIYVGGGGPAQVRVQPAASGEGGVEGYHMTLDEHGIPHNHSERLWGEYIDKDGRAAVGFHSHDPVSGNAQ